MLLRAFLQKIGYRQSQAAFNRPEILLKYCFRARQSLISPKTSAQKVQGQHGKAAIASILLSILT
jgi:hypothetical protein